MTNKLQCHPNLIMVAHQVATLVFGADAQMCALADVEFWGAESSQKLVINHVGCQKEGSPANAFSALLSSLDVVEPERLSSVSK